MFLQYRLKSHMDKDVSNADRYLGDVRKHLANSWLNVIVVLLIVSAWRNKIIVDQFFGKLQPVLSKSLPEYEISASLDSPYTEAHAPKFSANASLIKDIQYQFYDVVSPLWAKSVTDNSMLYMWHKLTLLFSDDILPLFLLSTQSIISLLLKHLPSPAQQEANQ